jgi:D-3-phosphoglycerate dehydrogenase
MRVVVTHNPEDLDAYYGRAMPALRAIDGVTVVTNPLDRDLTTAELADLAADCDIVVAHRSTPGEAALFERTPRLLAFLRTAVDISTVDVDAASAHGVLVGRADKTFVASTAELALALMLDVSRNVSDSTLEYRAGRQPPQRLGRQLRGRTAGIIGLGSIGAYLADVLAALGMHVVAHDPHVDPSSTAHRLVALDELLRTADYVVPLAASTPATHHLIGGPELARMRRGTVLVNVSRGELLDEAAVADALGRGHLGALAIDVGQAPDQRPSPALAGRPGVVATPHLGGLTPENADAQAASSVEQVAAIVAGLMPPRSVNPDAASRLEAWWADR